MVGTFLDWARHNKRSWKHDQFRVRPLLRAFAGKTLGEITPAAIETFKSIRLHSVTRRKTKRSPASVKHEMNVLSRIFSLAVTWGLADSNPCSRVSRIKLQNQRYRYLLPDEEPRLLAQCTGKRKHLAPMIAFAIGTGARKSEQLTLKVRQCDFFRSLIIFDKTKSNRPRFVEMNSEVREILMSLCKGKRPDDHVWLNPKTGKPFDDIKRAFLSACKDAGIEGLVWHDLRATYGEFRRGWFQRIPYRQANGPCEYLDESALCSQFASWRRRGSHAKKSAPSQQHRSHALRAGSGTLMVAVNS